MLAYLSDRAVISVSGAEAKIFLQGLITNDITKLAPKAPLYAGLLTPQGKVLFDFVLSERADEVLIDCWAPSVDSLLSRLTMYRLRAKVELRLRLDLGVFWSTDSIEPGFRDPRTGALGWRGLGEPDQSADGAAIYLAHRLSLGVPEGRDLESGRTFALDADLDELNGMSFDKGCYVGQELTARMKHRGTARKRLLPLATTDGSEVPPAGTEVRAGGVSLGDIISTYGRQGFASIRLDRLAEAGQSWVQAAATPIRITIPRWLAVAKLT